MRNVFIVSLFLFGFGFSSFAQIHPNTLGVRFGSGSINGAELTYQKALSRENRLELDLGFGGNRDYSNFLLVGSYHWVWNIVEDLNWYVGPAAGVSFVSEKHGNDYLNLGIGGQIGLEYDFNAYGVPLLLSMDGRPMINFFGNYSGFGWGIALGIRYTFK